MNTNKKEAVEPKAKISFGPFSEPRTVPSGWDISAFDSEEQAAENSFAAELAVSEALLLVKDLNADSEVAI
jgi:hypothetical protein